MRTPSILASLLSLTALLLSAPPAVALDDTDIDAIPQDRDGCPDVGAALGLDGVVGADTPWISETEALGRGLLGCPFARLDVPPSTDFLGPAGTLPVVLVEGIRTLARRDAHATSVELEEVEECPDADTAFLEPLEERDATRHLAAELRAKVPELRDVSVAFRRMRCREPVGTRAVAYVRHVRDRIGATRPIIIHEPAAQPAGPLAPAAGALDQPLRLTFTTALMREHHRLSYSAEVIASVWTWHDVAMIDELDLRFGASLQWANEAYWVHTNVSSQALLGLGADLRASIETPWTVRPFLGLGLRYQPDLPPRGVGELGLSIPLGLVAVDVGARATTPSREDPAGVGGFVGIRF